MSSRSRPQRAGGPRSKRQRTREALLDAAAALFRRKGIMATSLDEIAAHAGMTKGAIYGNFSGKDDLVFAVATERAPRPRPIFDQGRPFDEQLDDLIRSASALTPAALRQFAVLLELDLYTVTHEKFRKRLAAFGVERYRWSAENLASIMDVRELPLPPLQFAIAVHALVNGLLFQRAFFPDLIDDGTLAAALQALAGNACARRRKSKRHAAQAGAIHP